MKRFLLVSTSCFFAIAISSASDSVKLSRQEYIRKYEDDAIRDMKKTGVPASITLAQACLESNDGNSSLAIESNNHFGIKCADWKGDSYIQDDDRRNECFRKYDSVLESYDDHSRFLKTRPRYAELFTLDPTDYKGWAHGLKKAGYATNPQYANLLIKIIEENRLYELDHGRPVSPAVFEPLASAKPAPVIRRPSGNVQVPATDIINPYGTREVFYANGVPYIIAKTNDTYRGIADEYEMGEWQIIKYNDISDKSRIQPGERIYLKPKKREAGRSFCIVRDGESLHDIAQEHGVKMRLLMKWNQLTDHAAVKAGQKIYLKDRKS